MCIIIGCNFTTICHPILVTDIKKDEVVINVIITIITFIINDVTFVTATSTTTTTNVFYITIMISILHN